MQQNVSAEPESALKLANFRILDTVSKIGGCIAIVTAVAYIVGWRIASIYFGEFGADWLVPDLSASELIGNMGALAFALATWLFLFAWHVSEKFYSELKLFVFGCIAVLAGMVCETLSYQFPWLDVAPEFLFPIGVASCAVYLVYGARTSQWGGFDWSTANLIFLLALFWIPDSLGTQRAIRDLDAERSKLPDVELTTAPDERWKLLRSAGTNLVLVKLGGPKRYPVIRVVSVNAVSSIHKPSPFDAVDVKASSRGAVNANP